MNKYLSYTADEIDERLGKAHDHSNKSALDSITSAKVAAWDAKQDTLTAGTGIDITDNVISATGGGYPDWIDDVGFTTKSKLKDTGSVAFMIEIDAIDGIDSNGKMLFPHPKPIDLKDSWVEGWDVLSLAAFQDWVDRMGGIQKKLIAGSGITIAADGKTISVTGGGGGGDAVWGSITGTLSNQTDLDTALMSKADASEVNAALADKQDTISDVVDTAVKGQLVTAVSQTDGGISVTRAGASAFDSGGGIGVDGNNTYLLHCNSSSSDITRMSYAALLSWILSKTDDIYNFKLTAGTGISISGNVISATGGGGSSKSVNVLFVGNSFSKNSVAYLPYLLSDMAPDLEYRVAIASISGAPLAQHYASLYNESVSVGGTTYTPESYNYWEIDDTETKWAGGDPTAAHQTWQDAEVVKSISDILADGPWDIICIQQGGQTAASSWDTHYAPFIYGIQSKVSEIATTNGYAMKFAWNLTHGAYQATHANQKTAWQGTATNSEYVMERTGTSLLFPYGTAVQNLRTTSLDTAGVGGDGIGLLAGDTTHLHEGIAKYAAAMAIALPLLHDLGIIANPVSDDFRITKALTETYNVPYPNYGTSGTVKGIDDAKCFIAQMAAIAAVNNPYSETDLSGYEGNTPETYTVKNYLNSGGSYIDLGVKVLDEKWDVESKFRLVNTTTQVWLYWFRGNSGNYEQVSQILYTSGDGAPRWPICSRSSATNGTRPQVTSMNASTDYTVSTSGTHAYLNGTQLSNTMVEEAMYKPDHNFELFSKIHTNGDGSSTAREVSPNLRVYFFKLKHSDGTVAIDLVPAVRDSDSAVGMLDQNTNIFYPCVGGSPSVG